MKVWQVWQVIQKLLMFHPVYKTVTYASNFQFGDFLIQCMSLSSLEVHPLVEVVQSHELCNNGCEQTTRVCFLIYSRY